MNFDAEILTGKVRLTCKTLANTTKLVLDTSYLEIQQANLLLNGCVSCDFAFSDRDARYGSALTITFPELSAGQTVDFEIFYSTTKQCTAVQWLTREQTIGKKHP